MQRVEELGTWGEKNKCMAQRCRRQNPPGMMLIDHDLSRANVIITNGVLVSPPDLRALRHGLAALSGCPALFGVATVPPGQGGGPDEVRERGRGRDPRENPFELEGGRNYEEVFFKRSRRSGAIRHSPHDPEMTAAEQDTAPKFRYTQTPSFFSDCG